MEIPVQANLRSPGSSVVKRIFINSAQQALKVFVEPGEVANRPKLVRILKNGGGALCETVSDADIVVVTPETVSATQLLESWLGEKVFLDTSWVYESNKRGAAYLEDENWGEFVIPNGNVTAVQNHLPTPRQTPSDSKAPEEDSIMEHQQGPHNLNQYIPAGSPVPNTPFQLQQVAQQLPNGQVAMMSMPLMMQNYPGGGPLVPVQYFPQFMSAMQQQGANTAAMGIAQAAQQFPPGFTQQGIPFMPGQLPQGTFAYPQQSIPFPQQMMTVPYTQQPMDVVGSPGPSVQYHDSVSSANQSLVDRKSSISDSYRGSPLLKDEPIRKRKSGRSDAAPNQKKQKKAKPQDEDSSDHSASDSYEEPPLRFANASSTRTLQRNDATDDEKFFLKGPGKPSRFFVQLSLRNRTEISTLIKKHGGVMEADIANADFVVLGHPTSRSFPEYYRQSCNLGKTAVKWQWVLKCIERSDVIDFDGYAYEGLKLEKKRGRLGSSGQEYIVKWVLSGSEGGKSDEDVDEGPEEEPEPPKKRQEKAKERKMGKQAAKNGTSKPEKVDKKSTGKVDKQATSKVDKKATGKVDKKATSKVDKKGTYKSERDDGASTSAMKVKTKEKEKAKTPTDRSAFPNGLWLRSPSPPTRAVEFVNGRNLYTREEEDFCERYIPILLQRDPDMNNTTIVDKLHLKMPQHTKASWMSHLTHPSRRDKLDKYRRRAEILDRKVQAEWNPTKALAGFFASGRADTLEDQAVWQIMAEEYPQMSVRDWEKYWGENHATVQQELSRLTGLKSSEGSKAEPE